MDFKLNHQRDLISGFIRTKVLSSTDKSIPSVIIHSIILFYPWKQIRIGINGFGRIGLIILRAALERTDIKVVAINDPFQSPQHIQYSLKYDSTHHNFDNKNISIDNVDGKDLINVRGQTIATYQERNPANIPWDKHDTHYICECTG